MSVDFVPSLELHSVVAQLSKAMASNDDLANGIAELLENVDMFCYVGNTLDEDGGCDSAVMAWVR